MQQKSLAFIFCTGNAGEFRLAVELNVKSEKGYTSPGTEARVNQQPPMHQLVVLSTGWVAFFHSAPDGVHLSPFLYAADHCIFFSFFFFLFLAVFPGPDLTYTYPAHFPSLINIAPTLVPYLLFYI
jgi:hypothetical protein